MASGMIVNKYNGPRAEPAFSYGRIPNVEAKAIRGWHDHLEDARGLAFNARKKEDPKEKIAFAIRAVAEYSAAIVKMVDYNSTHHDATVAKEIRHATSEMDALRLQMGLKSD